ncbi:alpha/beta fold hydrolase [Variovorax sp. J2P1-59]|uniref:alpha/beta fold hydrolase n=1 Tax=Variovorax flavidus TaxID=3053501 RepID=UPI0025786D8C|nr:alpha/beta fold hydrolase [Variovorax sp. J2P1-59]MDM0078876.1 alpha/beta fold hydrolase [Variovorax sp. J2P1-59]
MKALSKLWPCIAFGLALCLAGQSRAHWEDQPPHQMAQLGELKLEGGGVITNLKMSYVTHGKLNAAKDNAILFLHGTGGNHHFFDHHIGPGRALDTDKFFIICSDALGATQTGYEHSTSPTNSGLKMKFPQYNGRDMMKAQYMLVTEGLGISRLLAVVGISSGGSYSIQLAVSYPEFMDGIVPVSGGSFFGNTGRFRGSMRNSIIESCVGWNEGNYDENPKACATSYISVLIPYFYSRDWWERHIDTAEAYQRWRVAMGAFYLDVQDARDLYYLEQSFEKGWVNDTPGFNGSMQAALGSIKAKALFIHALQDEFIPPKNVAAEVKMIPNARDLPIDSDAGHTIWYNADPQATVAVSRAIKAFLADLTVSKAAGR